MSAYPDRGRSAWILSQRPSRQVVSNPDEPRGVFLEDERLASGRVVSTGVVLLTNRECPWKCLMCDLWKETTVESVPSGSIVRQIRAALSRWPDRRPEQMKLYNSGSFFDPGAIEPESYPDVARLVSFAANTVVESHPRLVGARALRLRDLLDGSLEVAMGLETAHPEVLRNLNKGFDLGHFEQACGFLRREGIGIRAFLLVHAPFLGRDESLDWCSRSAEFAFECGADAVALIPTRAGNGAMEVLRASGEFVPPALADLERAQSAVLALHRGRVFADTWGAEGFSACGRCAAERVARLKRMNGTQLDEPFVACPECGGT